MALVFVDGFDHYAALAQMWDVYGQGGFTSAPTIGSSYGRNGTGGLYLQGSSAYVQKNVANAATYYLLFAMQLQGLPNAGAYTAICSSIDTGTAQVDLRINNSGQLYFTRNGTTIGSPYTLTNPLSYHHYQVKLTINSTTGLAELKPDGSSSAAISFSGNTQATGSSQINALVLGRYSPPNNQNFGDMYFDDVVILDTTGATNSDYLGDVRVRTLFASGDGGTTQWTNNGAATAHGCVAEHPPDDDTTYLSDSNVGDIDLLTYAAIPTNATIFSGCVLMRVRKDDAAARQVAAVSKSGGTTGVASGILITQTYAYYEQFFDTDPNTSAQWTGSNFNSAQWGVKVIA
jgi:hypothetical protein